MAINDPLVFTIEEESGSNPIKVELKDHDLPFGRPRRGGAFDIGTKVEIEDVLLDGRETPIIHTKFVDQLPTVIKGHLRDHFTGDDGHAHSTREDLMRIASRRRPLVLTCWKLKWRAFLREAKFPFEGPNDLPYELTFRVLTGPNTKVTVFDLHKTVAPVDLMANARAILAERQAEFLALAMTRVAAATLALAFDQADTSLDTCEQAAYAYENAPAKKADAQARALVSACQNGKAQCDNLIAVAQSFSPSVLRHQTAGNVATFKAQQLGTCADALDVKVSVLNAQTTANARIRKATKLYKVASGDTLEFIATAKLGNPARAADLGVRSQDLVVGRYVRIPTVT